jgi:4-carboxymuconolactone decarboxylase
MSRLPAVSRDSLDAEGQAIWDGIAAVRNPEMRGPFGVLIHSPKLAEKVANLEDYFRFDAELNAADRELVVLSTAREMDARYPWTRHEVRGREAGTREEAIEAVRAQGDLKGLTEREQLLVEIPRSLVRSRGIPDDLFQRALKTLGQQQLLEIVTLTGHYSLIGMIANGFSVEAPEGAVTF